MSQHRFAIGQEVVLKSSHYNSNASPGLYHVTAILPEKNNFPQYRIRNDMERHERMVTEDCIEAHSSSPLPDPHVPRPSLDRIAASRPGSPELLEYARLQKSDSDGTLRRMRRLVEDNRLL